MTAARQRVRWSKRERALLYQYDGDVSTSRVIAWAFEDVLVFKDRTLAQELESRGYDLSTLRFSIKPKEAP